MVQRSARAGKRLPARHAPRVWDKMVSDPAPAAGEPQEGGPMAKRVQQKRAQRRRRVLRAQRRAPLRRPAHHARTEDAAARVVRAIGHRAQALIQAYALSTRPARHLPPVQATEMPPPRMVEALYTLVHRVLALAEEGIRLVRREAPPKLPLACGKGCAWCCSLQVPVSAPEVLLLAEALRQTRSPDSLA